MSNEQLFLDWFKERSEFFKAGSIIPQRILKGKRKWKHLFKFGSDSWALPTPNGYLVAVDTWKGLGAVHVKFMKNCVKLDLNGSPYGGVTNWVGNHAGNDEVWSKILEERYNLSMGKDE